MADLPMTATVGVLHRRKFRRLVREFAFRQGWNVTIVEDRGWLDSDFAVTITVPDDEARTARQALNAWTIRLNEAMA